MSCAKKQTKRRTLVLFGIFFHKNCSKKKIPKKKISKQFFTPKNNRIKNELHLYIFRKPQQQQQQKEVFKPLSGAPSVGSNISFKHFDMHAFFFAAVHLQHKTNLNGQHLVYLLVIFIFDCLEE